MFLEHIDQQLFLAINGCHNTFFDWLMWSVSNTFTWLPLYLVTLFYIFKRERKQIWLAVLAIALLILLADQISVRLFKDLFQRYRPCHNLALKDQVHIVFGRCGGLYGFVSSHAANFFALAVFLSLYFKKRWVTIFSIAIAGLISYSRIYLGVHYPADVFVGAILGIIIGVAVSRFYFLIKPKIFGAA